jgi:HK97 family phage major capsid protein
MADLAAERALRTAAFTELLDATVPRVTQDVSAAWTLEGAEIATSDAVTDQLSCVPSKLASLTVVSNELMADSSPTPLSIVGQSCVRDLKRKIDAAWLTATTPNGPSGLPSLTTSTASAGGSWDDFDWAQAAISAAETLNSQVTSFVTSPATALQLSTVKAYAAAGSNVPLMQPDPTKPGTRVIAGVPLLVSPSVAADTIWAVPQQHSLFVLRQPATVVSDSSVYFSKDSTAIRGTLRVGFCFPHPMSVVKITKA